ncbi:MAG: dTDP-4-keto-6-deoxy-D-glucose epimerase [Chloroflexi bacterium]|nr:MAG: dTDP-4-keto-6-deoxy-D-glucose epimerase [Chloroflexota bacterium]
MSSTPIQAFPTIDGVYTVPIKAYVDARGQFMETFRREWFPWVNWEKIQHNRSDSKAGVLRGLHYHFWQIDYWYVSKGIIRVGMVDLRPSSPTYLQAATLEMGDSNNIGLFIPIGVAHGFLALTDCILTYVVNNYYNGGVDERGVLWNDPTLGIDWQITNEPIISERDQTNRLLKDIPADELPT